MYDQNDFANQKSSKFMIDQVGLYTVGKIKVFETFKKGEKDSYIILGHFFLLTANCFYNWVNCEWNRRKIQSLKSWRISPLCFALFFFLLATLDIEYNLWKVNIEAGSRLLSLRLQRSCSLYGIVVRKTINH